VITADLNGLMAKYVSHPVKFWLKASIVKQTIYCTYVETGVISMKCL
jgi:hypothetical protein